MWIVTKYEHYDGTMDTGDLFELESYLLAHID